MPRQHFRSLYLKALKTSKVCSYFFITENRFILTRSVVCQFGTLVLNSIAELVSLVKCNRYRPKTGLEKLEDTFLQKGNVQYLLGKITDKKTAYNKDQPIP